jgi:hypothetical protein
MCEVFRSALGMLLCQDIWMEYCEARTLLQALGLLPHLERVHHRAFDARFHRRAREGSLLLQGRGSIREL